MNAVTQLPWNQEQYGSLLELEKTRHLGHAYLVLGQKGIGKESLVRDFSAWLLCQNKQEQQACGQCKSCQLLAAGSHPDFRDIGLEEESSQIKIEQVREGGIFLNKTAMMTQYKVLLIRSAEKMNLNAANAILKNLEEPAANTIIFLLSHQPGLLLPTVRSRCQVIRMSLPAKELVLPWLQQQLDPEQAAFCLALAHGAPLLACDYAEESKQEESREIQKTLLELLCEGLITTDAARMLAQYEIDDVLDVMMLSLLQLLRLLQTVNNNQKADAEVYLGAYSAELEGICNILDSKQIAPLHKFYKQLLDIRRAIQSPANPNVQLLLESLCYQWTKLGCDKSINRFAKI